MKNPFSSGRALPLTYRSILRPRAFLLGLLPFALLATAFGAPAEPVIAAYVFPRSTVLAPGQIAAAKLTRINYAFANIDEGLIVEGDPVDAANFAFLEALKHDNPKLTVLVSVGGWLWSGGFSEMSLTSQSRARFIDSVAAFVAKYKLDGLDIDWEYPGLPGATQNFRPVDKQNYTLLLKELRTRFDAVQKQTGQRLYITIATGSSTEFLEHTEMSKVQKYVDTVNLMAYDYYEPSDGKITGNHAPLFTDPADPKKVSADRSVREYEQAGVPAAKIVLGVPFYGHVWGQVPPMGNGLFQPGQAAPNTEANYAAISTTMLGRGYNRYWDAASSAPYLYNADKQIFVSYEDPQSLLLKSEFVRKQGLAGMMFWDYGSDPSGALLDTIDKGLQHQTPVAALQPKSGGTQ